jgi:4-amino-4-deoxy-L-arabinose transferase-like glycosyltransferase
VTGQPTRKRTVLCLTAATAAYLPLVSLPAIRKPFWFDEFFTVAIARQPGLGDVMRIMASGQEPHLPLLYLLVRVSQRWLGVGELAARLPSILAYWVFCLSLFVFCRRRLGVWPATVALVFPLACSSYPLAFEARPYALVLAACGLALVFWQRAAEGGARAGALAGLVLALAAAVSSHYYAVLLIPLFVSGEAVRLARRRAPDWPLWLALAAPLALFGIYLPWIWASRRVMAGFWIGVQNFWAKPEWIDVGSTYVAMFLPALAPLLPGYTLLLLARRRGAARAPESGFKSEEWAVITALLSLPLWVFLLGKFMAGIYMPRYSVPVVAGAAALVAAAVQRESRGQAKPVALLVLVIVAWSGWNGWRISRGYERPDVALSSLLARVPDGNIPIVVADPARFVQLSYYARPPASGRIVFWTDPASARTLPDFVPELVLPILGQWMPLRVEPYGPGADRNRRILVYSLAASSGEWLPARLAGDGWKLNLVAERGRERLLLATAPVQ